MFPGGWSAKYIDPSVKGKAKQGKAWGYNGDVEYPHVLYDFMTYGRREGSEVFLKQYRGYI